MTTPSNSPSLDLLDTVEVIHNPTQQPITRSVIWLHGLGANGHDFEPIVPELGLNGDHGVRFIFPHAPAIAITVNNGYVMPAWYDIFEMSLDRKIDIEQIEQSSQRIKALIEREIARGSASEHIVLAGFSQGGAVAYQTALTYDKPLAGLLALSTYFATKDTIKLNPINQTLPIAIHHGTHDPIVPGILAQQATQWLQTHNYAASYHTYPMAHQVCAPEIKTIGAWLKQVLA